MFVGDDNLVEVKVDNVVEEAAESNCYNYYNNDYFLLPKFDDSIILKIISFLSP